MSQLTDGQLITEATVIKTETALGANTADRVGTMFVDSIDSKINVDVIDSNIALGTSDAAIPTQNAVKTYTDGLVVGLVDDRGNFTPSATSPGGYPTTNGSGAGGIIEKGDLYFIDTVGYLSTTPVSVGTSVRALTTNPGQTAANWNILNVGLGFTPENVLNKSTNVNLGTSNTLYPSQNAVKSYVDTKAVSKTGDNTISGNNAFTGVTSFQNIVASESAFYMNNGVYIGLDSPIFLETIAGTSGQVLTSQGGAATPTWETPTPGISPADNTTFTGSNTFSQTTQFTAGILSPVGGTSTFNGTLDVNGFFRVDGQSGTVGQILTSQGSGTPIWADAGGLSYKVYSALLSYNGTSITTIILQNTIGNGSGDGIDDIAWAYTGSFFTATMTAAPFLNNKTAVITQGTYFPGGGISYSTTGSRLTNSTVRLLSYRLSDANVVTSVLTNHFVEIRVYL